MLLAGGDLPSTMARDMTFHRRQRRSFQKVPLHRLAPQAKAQSTTNIYSLALRCAARTGRRKAGWHETNLHVWVATILPLHFLGFEFPGRCPKVIYNPTAPGVGFWPAKQKIVGGRTPEPKWIDREKSAIKTAALLSQKSFSLLWTCLSHLLQAFIRHYTIFCKPTNKLTTATLVFLWAKKSKTLSCTCWLPHHHRRFHLTIQCTSICQFNVLGIVNSMYLEFSFVFVFVSSTSSGSSSHRLQCKSWTEAWLNLGHSVSGDVLACAKTATVSKATSIHPSPHYCTVQYFPFGMIFIGCRQKMLVSDGQGLQRKLGVSDIFFILRSDEEQPTERATLQLRELRFGHSASSLAICVLHLH